MNTIMLTIFNVDFNIMLTIFNADSYLNVVNQNDHDGVYDVVFGSFLVFVVELIFDGVNNVIEFFVVDLIFVWFFLFSKNILFGFSHGNGLSTFLVFSMKWFLPAASFE